jgi:hypothetical protein
MLVLSAGGFAQKWQRWRSPKSDPVSFKVGALAKKENRIE